MNALRVSIEPATAEYQGVVFLQGEDATDALTMLEEVGPVKAAESLLDTYGGLIERGPWEFRPPFGSSDLGYWVLQDGDSGFVISRHKGGLYVALTAWREIAA